MASAFKILAEIQGIDAFEAAVNSTTKKGAQAVEAELERLANDVANDARAAVPVGETGELLGSIRVERDSPSQVVVNAGRSDSVDYAGHVEYGTSKMSAQPFMRPASASAESNLELRMTGVVRRGLGVSE